MFESAGFKPTTGKWAPRPFVPGHLASPPKLSQRSLIDDILKAAQGPWGDIAFRGLTGGVLTLLAVLSEFPMLLKLILGLMGGLWIYQAVALAVLELESDESIEV